MEFIAELTNLHAMMAYVHQQGSLKKIDTRYIRRMELACEEAIVNIISYAYPKKKGQLNIECIVHDEQKFEVVLTDYGIPFNPIDSDVNLQADTPIHERKMGGIGIYLIRKVLDEASYQRVGKRNILRLALRFYPGDANHSE